MGSTTELSVHLAGSDYVTIAGLTGVLERSGFITVQGCSNSGTETIDYLAGESPDLLLIDTGIRNHGLVATMAAIDRMAPPLQTVLLSDRGSGEDVEAAFRSGACGLLVRGPTLEDIAPALRIIYRGGAVSSVCPVLPPDAGQLRPAYPELSDSLASLKLRDRKIVKAIAEGHTNAHIAQRLHLSEATVKSRLGQIMSHLGAENRVQIAVAAARAEFMHAQTGSRT